MKNNYRETGTTATLDPRDDVRDKSKVRGGDADKEMMKKAEEAGRPGPAHKALEHYVGDWKAEVKCWMEPGGAPDVSQGTARVSWIMNGRFLEEDFRGEIMGKPFRGRTVIGYDNVKRTFQCSWISDMQTSMFTTEGDGENGNKVITLKGTASCPMQERGDIPMKVVLRELGPDRHSLEMFDETEGEEFKTMEILYTRV